MSGEQEDHDKTSYAECPPSGTASYEARLAFVEGFLLGLARRIDDVNYQWPKAEEAADDCRAVAKAIKQIGVPMDRVVVPTAQK